MAAATRLLRRRRLWRRRWRWHCGGLRKLPERMAAAAGSSRQRWSCYAARRSTRAARQASSSSAAATSRPTSGAWRAKRRACTRCLQGLTPSLAASSQSSSSAARAVAARSAAAAPRSGIGPGCAESAPAFSVTSSMVTVHRLQSKEAATCQGAAWADSCCSRLPNGVASNRSSGCSCMHYAHVRPTSAPYSCSSALSNSPDHPLVYASDLRCHLCLLNASASPPRASDGAGPCAHAYAR
mmetsp:Transcript_32018/g.95647  ORF Transcript_32018/g.95647 Transcript_32018/m.95647 type:complete len:240 (+) Transcript_32018:459-1178(+)